MCVLFPFLAFGPFLCILLSPYFDSFARKQLLAGFDDATNEVKDASQPRVTHTRSHDLKWFFFLASKRPRMDPLCPEKGERRDDPCILVYYITITHINRQTNKSAGVTWRVKLGRQLLQHIRHIRRSDRSDYHVRSGRNSICYMDGESWDGSGGMDELEEAAAVCVETRPLVLSQENHPGTTVGG